MLEFAKLVHEAIGIESPRAFVALWAIVGLVIFGCIGWLVDKGYRVKLQEQAAHAASTVAPRFTGSNPISPLPPAPQPKVQPNPAPAEGLTFPGFRENVTNVSLSIGSIHASIPLAGLRNGTYKGAAFNINGQIITPYLEGNHVYVDVSVYRGPDLPAVQVRKGMVTVDVPGWDRNSNESAFEVVNERGIPVFQMVYVTPSDVSIRGILVFAGGLVMVANETTNMLNPRNPFELAPKPLFKYPSRLHRGEPVG